MIPEENPLSYLGKRVTINAYESRQDVYIIDVEYAPATPLPGDFTWINRQEVWFIAEYVSELA